MPRSPLNTNLRHTVAFLLSCISLFGCSGSSGGPVQDNIAGGQSGTANSGGNDSSSTPFGGGTAATIGGANGNGDSAKGGAAAGGIAQGGNSRGGASSGGAVSAGGSLAAGGTNNLGGAATGGQSGSATGGSVTGGKASGGQSAGGAATGGKAAGGSTAGGQAIGGTATGGNASGGAATGGAGVGGSAGTGGSTWKQCFSNDKMPTNPGLKIDPAATGYTTTIDAGGYLTMLIGPNRPACITDAVAKRNLAQLDVRLRSVVELAGFPAFAPWKTGYFMNWVILNSGIPGATNGGEGGHQGNRFGHMNFESTQECPCTWDDYQSFGAWHECVHALQAELWKFNNEASGWIHEAHNEYLTDTATALADNKYSIGWFSSLILQMPHVPIESMGLTKDDSVAGPSDQNASAGYINDQVRYGLEIFFFSLSQLAGRGFVNCLWTDPPTGNSKSVFQVLQGIAGEAAAASTIMAFAANSAILDFAGWTEAVRSTMKANWNNNWWFYMFPGGDGTTAFRPVTKQIPHHQGRNIIPIQVNNGATAVTVEFTPDGAGSKGTKEKMQAQLVYRDSADKAVYGTVFSSGQGTIQLPIASRNGIVNLVVAVTNANAASGGDDDSNKGFDAQEHFSYQARIVSGGVIAPNATRPW